MAGLHNGPDGYGEGLPANVTLAGPDFGAFPVQTTNPVTFTALRANRTIRPKARFDERHGSGFIAEMVG
jgi:hypothetical protein